VANSIPNSQIHDRSLSWLCTGTSIKGGGINLYSFILLKYNNVKKYPFQDPPLGGLQKFIHIKGRVSIIHILPLLSFHVWTKRLAISPLFLFQYFIISRNIASERTSSVKQLNNE
jgi:hypothetical protein